MVVMHNLPAVNANRMFGINTSQQMKSTEKLSSGYAINRAADDASGLAISEKMRRQIRGLTQAAKNAQDGISMVQTAEGALNEVHDMLHRLNELCVKAANGTLMQPDRSYIQKEVDAVVDEIDRVGKMTAFNEKRILNGFPQESTKVFAPDVSGVSGSLSQATLDMPAGYKVAPLSDNSVLSVGNGSGTRLFYQITDQTPANAHNDGSSAQSAIPTTKDRAYSLIASSLYSNNRQSDPDVSVNVTYSRSGPDEGKYTIEFFGPLKVDLQVGAEADQQIEVKINTVTAGSLGITGINVNDANGVGAKEGLEKVKNAISVNSAERAKLGAVQNRLEHTIKNLDNVVENTTAAESTIRDTDMASMMVSHTNRNILLQAGQSMLAQANQANSGVLSLIQS